MRLIRDDCACITIERKEKNFAITEHVKNQRRGRVGAEAEEAQANLLSSSLGPSVRIESGETSGGCFGEEQADWDGWSGAETVDVSAGGC